jgi:hypothetical protein
VTDEVLPGVKRRIMSYEAYRVMAEDCDAAIFEPHNIFGRIVASHSGGPFCHIGGLVWYGQKYDGRLVLCEYHERVGGHAVPFRSAVERRGACSIFRVRGLTKKQAKPCARALFERLGNPYDWHGIAMIALMHICPMLSKDFVAKHLSQGLDSVCSRHYVDCLGLADVIFTRKNSRFITPNDVAQSPAVEYVCTIKPEDM